MPNYSTRFLCSWLTALGLVLTALTAVAQNDKSPTSEPASAAQPATAEARQIIEPALAKETPAQLAPSETASVLRILAAGSKLKPATAPTADLSANWHAISLDGPFTLYVRNGDIDKGLAIKPASPLYLEPDNAAAVVAYAEEGDAITITGLRGRWTQIELQKPLTAYVAANAIAVKSGNAVSTTSDTPPETESEPPTKTLTISETPSPTASTEAASVELPEPEELTAEPEQQASLTVLAEAETGKPVLLAVIDSEPDAQTATNDAQAQSATIALADAAPAGAQAAQAAAGVMDASATTTRQIKGSATPPNRSQLQGKLVRTRNFFGSRRGYSYEWQLNAKFSFRVAYLDFSRMQGTEQLARYAGQQIVVYGLVSPLGDGQYVMRVESIRLQ